MKSPENKQTTRKPHRLRNSIGLVGGSLAAAASSVVIADAVNSGNDQAPSHLVANNHPGTEQASLGATTPAPVETTTTSIAPTTSTPNTPPTTESVNQQANETSGSVLQKLTHPAIGDKFKVVNQTIHVLSKAPVFDRATSVENGANQIQYGLSGNATQAVVVSDESGDFICVRNPNQSQTVACIKTSDPNSNQYLIVLANNNPDTPVPYSQAVQTGQITYSEVTVNQLDELGNPLADTPDGEVAIGGFIDLPGTR